MHAPRRGAISMITYLIITALVAVLAGIGLAYRCRAFVLLPATALLCAMSTAGGLTLDADIWPIVLAALVAIIGLQLGFLGTAAVMKIGIHSGTAEAPQTDETGSHEPANA